jgi:hypothetical protein
MADLPTHSDTGDEPAARQQAEEPEGGATTRQKVIWISIGVAVLLVLVVLHLTGVVGSQTNG